MKILYVIGQLAVGGTETQLLELVKHLNHKKYKAAVACLSQPAPLAESLRAAGCEVTLLNREKNGRWAALRDLYLLQKRFQPDIVHAFAYAARAALPIAGLFSRARSILSIRTQPERYSIFLDWLVNSFADYALTNSQKAADSLRSFLPRRIPIKVIYNGINLKEFEARSAALPAMESGNKVICATGRLYAVKGHRFLLESFALVARQSPDAQLWLLGAGPEEKALQRQAADLNITDKVKFMGHQTNVPAMLKNARIGVLPSQNEGLPNAVIEYMAARLPVVATDVGGNSEVIVHGKTGLLTPFGDPQKMADALLFLLQNPATARAYGVSGRRRIESLFSIERMLQEMEEVYEKTLS